MDTGERLEALERDFEQVTAQLSAVNLTLQGLASMANQIPPTTAQSTDTTMDSSGNGSQSTWNVPERSGIPGTSGIPSGTPSKLKPATPSDYNGDRSKGRAFLNSCELYIRLSPNRFPDEASQVYWALTYMKTDRAYTFTNRTLRYENILKQPRFSSWAAFRTEFIKEFFPRNEAQRAITSLEATTYFQGKRSVDEYIDKFKDLIDLSGYHDGLTIVVKFRRGLNPEIQNYIANMMEGRPEDDDCEGWYSAASRCDENRAANAAFQSSLRSPFSTRFPVTQVRTPTIPARQTGTSHVPPSIPTSNLPAPMDVDATKRGGIRTSACYRCGKTGHLIKDCPQGFDVRFMTEDEREDWIQQLLAGADVGDEKDGEPETKKGVEESGDFVPSDE